MEDVRLELERMRLGMELAHMDEDIAIGQREVQAEKEEIAEAKAAIIQKT